MGDPVLLADAATNAATGIVYAVVGWRLSQRRGAGGSAVSERAWQRFIHWWFALALTGFLAAAFSALAYAQVADVALYATLQYSLIVTFAFAMACLVYYVGYLWTGREWIKWPVRLVYVVYVLVFIYEISASRPAGIVVRGWRPVLEYETPFYPGFLALSFLFLFLPQTLVCVTYLTLYFRTDDRASRRRILLVAMGILLVSAGAVVISRPPAVGDAWLQAGARIAVIAAAFSILAAYLPERAPTRSKLESRAAIAARARDLV